jgi:hypothetical protein
MKNWCVKWIIAIDYITDSFWIGTLRNFDSRVTLPDTSNLRQALKKIYGPANVRQVYKQMKDLPKIMWKDSIRKIIGEKE